MGGCSSLSVVLLLFKKIQEKNDIHKRLKYSLMHEGETSSFRYWFQTVSAGTSSCFIFGHCVMLRCVPNLVNYNTD